MNRYVLEKISGILLIFVLVSADAATIYSQTPAINGGLVSDADPFTDVGFPISQFAADDFMLGSAATVTNVVWRGLDSGTPSADDFTINFYTGASVPAALLQSFSIGTPSSRTDTGLSISDFGIFEYVADLGSGISLSSGTTYWISIFNNTVGDGFPDFWGWVGNTNASTGAPAAILATVNFIPSPTWINVNDPDTGQELYFQFNPMPVPIPAAAWLFGSALGLLGWMRRRKVN